mmetsp:Transcript_34815/g.99391  ORF Transcript_34815/g.99391 Transcript_34815/m.99391 type:complete len:224 (-) Transcript_34815:1472-2143(-)
MFSQQPTRRDAAPRIPLEQTEKEFDGLGGQQARRVPQVHRHDLPAQLLHVAPERGVANQQLVDESSQSPEVNCHILRVSLEDLWCPVVGCAAGCPQRHLHLYLCTPAEVTDAHLVLICQQHVLGLQVPVDAHVLVHKVDALADLREVPRGPCLGEPVGRLPRTETAKGAAWAVLEHHINVRFILEAGQEPQDVAVLEPTLDPDLTLQLRKHVPDVERVLLHDL